ncbi:hypothetical protein GCM10009860_07190 [Microbacterium mitrae]|uniref:Large extracellular alpha-helical protein n=1 Tax=Microbacterium mitrae TaxID=664640 RepID=A0A5C8HPP9_9MICO|nr:DUF5719 family protein [Microbacterium mitrae]TXK06086.1 large extracellular alpha-helical protein [Microbacterium mitrae]
MSTPRNKAIHLSARLVGGLVIIAGATIGVAASIAAPFDGVTAVRPAITAQPAAGTTMLGCSGPLLAVGRDAANAQALSIAQTPRFVTSDAPGLREEPVALVSVPDATSTMFAADPIDGERVAIAAAGSLSITSPDITGFAAYACQPAAMQSWIVGADTLTGSTGVLTLTNPGEVTATVDVTIYGATGPQPVPGSTGIVVAAGATVAVDLASLAGDEFGPVLRVDAHDTPVLANLQSGLVRTLVTGGVDVQSAVAAPSTMQIVPGIVVSDSGDGAMEFQRARILSPAETTAAQVSFRAVGESADSYVTTVALEGGIPTEVELPALPAGTYVMTVNAVKPVVAGVWSTTGYEDGSDFAWATATLPLTEGATPFAVADGAAPSLTLANPGETRARVSVTTPAGDRDYTINPGAAIAVPVTAASSGTVTVASGTVHAAVSFAGENATATYPVWPADAAAMPVVVRH